VPFGKQLAFAAQVTVPSLQSFAGWGAVQLNPLPVKPSLQTHWWPMPAGTQVACGAQDSRPLAQSGANGTPPLPPMLELLPAERPPPPESVGLLEPQLALSSAAKNAQQVRVCAWRINDLMFIVVVRAFIWVKGRSS
jgi:hypothetical protein